jgi:hypothetical protein
MANLAPLNRVPAVLDNIINQPPQPANPPSDEDIVRAAYFVKQVYNSHGLTLIYLQMCMLINLVQQ